MTAPQNPRVTQADRDAAQSLCASGWTHAIQAFARHREAAEAASKAREAALVEALRLAEDALRNHACSGLGAPCLRSIEQCRTDCGQMAGQALDAVLAALTKGPGA